MSSGLVGSAPLRLLLLPLPLLQAKLSNRALTPLAQLCDHRRHPVLQQHVVLRRQAHAGPEHVDDALALCCERVDHRSALGHQGGLEEVREQAQHGVHPLIPLSALSPRRASPTSSRRSRQTLHLDPLTHLAQDSEVQDEWGGQQAVLAGVVHHDGVAPAQEYLTGVFVHGSLAVLHVGHVLYDHTMVRPLPLLVQDAVGVDHVVHHV
mmetsp:Transcript_35219/g.75971  ORF Transcript_35219/g.75971 Transcript_35219/m.75971 type:complete len:208 (-) Transcript_35219:1124-1747(-)